MIDDYGMNNSNQQNKNGVHRICYYDQETGEYYVISGAERAALEMKAAEFERAHDMSRWTRLPNIWHGLDLPSVRGHIEPCPDEDEVLLCCNYPFPDDSIRHFKGRSVSEVRFKIIKELYKYYSAQPRSMLYNSLLELGANDLEKFCISEEEPQFPLNKYTVTNYMNRYIDELKVVTEEKLARLSDCSKSTICRIKVGETTTYKRNRMLIISFGLELPRADLYQFIRAVAADFPSTPIERKIKEQIDIGNINYKRFINWIKYSDHDKCI